VPAGKATFAFDYDAPFHQGPDGMFRVKVGADWYSWTQFESIDGRAAYPAFDQPGYKQPFTVTAAHAQGAGRRHQCARDLGHAGRRAGCPPFRRQRAAAHLSAGDDGRPLRGRQGRGAPTPQRAQPLPLRVVSTKENADKLGFALENSKQIVAHLENYFGQSFPYPKLDQISAPIMGGAMENAGADLYQDKLLIVTDKDSTEDKREFGMVVAHELAHQWFGDLVTPPGGTTSG
jgi:aminopeptidase N